MLRRIAEVAIILFLALLICPLVALAILTRDRAVLADVAREWKLIHEREPRLRDREGDTNW